MFPDAANQDDVSEEGDETEKDDQTEPMNIQPEVKVCFGKQFGGLVSFTHSKYQQRVGVQGGVDPQNQKKKQTQLNNSMKTCDIR